MDTGWRFVRASELDALPECVQCEKIIYTLDDMDTIRMYPSLYMVESEGADPNTPTSVQYWHKICADAVFAGGYDPEWDDRQRQSEDFWRSQLGKG